MYSHRPRQSGKNTELAKVLAQWQADNPAGRLVLFVTPSGLKLGHVGYTRELDPCKTCGSTDYSRIILSKPNRCDKCQ